MFHSAALRLTIYYLAIIMALSIGCSLVIYRYSSQDLTRNAQSQVGYFHGLLGTDELDTYQRLRSHQLSEDLDHLKANLWAFNLLVLVGGGALSYALARRSLEPIESALEAQKRFAADASHELRTPLAAMQSEIEVSLRNPKLTKSEATFMLESNLEEVIKLRSLADGLLRLASQASRADNGQVSNIDEAATTAISRLSKAAAGRNVKVMTELKPVKVAGDPSSLTDLVAILLDNAIKYSRRGAKVEVTSGRAGKSAYIKVKDYGAGIKKADLPQIFERFFRADASRSKEQADGYGLGLAIAKRIADLHGGHIEVKSMVGKGSTFTVFLPMA